MEHCFADMVNIKQFTIKMELFKKKWKNPKKALQIPFLQAQKLVILLTDEKKICLTQ